MTVLVGDIGGTKTELALARMHDAKVLLRHVCRYPSRDYPGLDAIVRRYSAENLLPHGEHPQQAVFAVAGPVANGRCEATNLPWLLDARALESAASISSVRLLNDLEAVAWGIDSLTEAQCVQLQAGDPASSGNRAVVAPGTGLGQAGLYWDGKGHRPFATEGGHTDFAPVDAREFALLEYLQGRFGRVSWERVASGMGIGNLYDFLQRQSGSAHHARLEQAMTGAGDVAATVSELAASGDCPVCRETMDWFARLLGREAGNTALKLMARGGLYLAGGIPAKNLDLLRAGGFLQAFRDKGRMSGLLEAIPVRLVLEERVALIGAARFAGLGQCAPGA